MDVIACRTRIAGSAHHYVWRALFPLDELDPARRHRFAIIHARTSAGRLPCRRITDTIAPNRWFERELAISCGLATRLNLVGRRVEAIFLQSIFPEMTARLVPPALRIDHDPGNAVHRVATVDLNATFDALAPRIETLTAADIGLDRACERRAA